MAKQRSRAAVTTRDRAGSDTGHQRTARAAGTAGSSRRTPRTKVRTAGNAAYRRSLAIGAVSLRYRSRAGCGWAAENDAAWCDRARHLPRRLPHLGRRVLPSAAAGRQCLQPGDEALQPAARAPAWLAGDLHLARFGHFGRWHPWPQATCLDGGGSTWWMTRSSRPAARATCSTCSRMAVVYTTTTAPGRASRRMGPSRSAQSRSGRIYVVGRTVTPCQHTASRWTRVDAVYRTKVPVGHGAVEVLRRLPLAPPTGAVAERPTTHKRSASLAARCPAVNRVLVALHVPDTQRCVRTNV